MALMTQDDAKTLITLVSAAIALVALTWNVASWRMAGPSLRFHCFWYHQVLVIRVFNAGRTADTVEQMDVGTRPRSALTQVLELPTRVEPGQSKEWRLGADYLTAERKEALAGGWAPLWTLSGSMRQQRSDIIPVNLVAPSAAGWRLVRRRARWWRYLPLATSLVTFFATDPRLARPVALVAIAAIIVWGLARAIALRPAAYSRARVQRRITAACLTLAATGGLVTAQRASAPLWHTTLQMALMGVALILANARTDETWLHCYRWGQQVLAKFRRLFRFGDGPRIDTTDVQPAVGESRSPVTAGPSSLLAPVTTRDPGPRESHTRQES